MVDLKNDNLNTNNSNLKIINVDLEFKKPFLVPQKASSIFVKNSLVLAHKIALKKDVKGFVNCAIDKSLLNKTKTGVTEFLARKCKIYDDSEVMMIRNNKLAVCPITTHIDIKDISKKLTIQKIVTKVNTINTWFKKKFRRKPNIGILGLNPHNAEFRGNSEEILKIIPAIIKLKKNKVNLKGPLIPDVVFIKDYKNYDVIVGMYHDQILSPFKSNYKYDAINVTLGLKYLRVSPDHGVAVDLIGKGKADETSLLRCINFVDRFGK